MRRRNLLGVLTWAALFNRADAQGGPARVGVLADAHLIVEAFTTELRALANRESRPIDIQIRLAEGRTGRYAAFARELVETRPDAIFAYGTQALTALQEDASTVPTVAVVGDVGATLASGSLRSPTHNVTGLSTLSNHLTGKRVEFLKELLPTARHFGVLLSMENPANSEIVARVRPFAETLNVQITPVNLADDLDQALQAIEQARIEGLIVSADPSFFARRELIVAALARHRVPTMYAVRDYVLAGGLMSYAPDYADLGRRAARYVDRILKGAHPSELPIQQAERFELLVNLKAASALGIKVAPGLLVRADEVIE